MPNKVRNWIGAQIRVISRYQKSWEFFRLVSKFSTLKPTYWSITGNINKVNTGTIKIAQPWIMKETHSDIANKIEVQNGTADFKDNKIFLSDISKTIDTLN